MQVIYASNDAMIREHNHGFEVLCNYNIILLVLLSMLLGWAQVYAFITTTHDKKVLKDQSRPFH